MATTLGAQLKSIRESRGISLEEIANKTHIRLTYLEALETGDTDQLAPGPQRSGFLKLYASELGVEIEGENVKGIQQDTELSDETIHSEVPDETISSEKPAEPITLESVKFEPSEDEIKTEEPQITYTEPERFTSDPEDPHRTAHQSTSTNSSDLFSKLGGTLNQRRQLLSLSIDDVHEHTHIRKKFLTAIEEGNFTQLPSPVQAQGILVNYADFLNLDVDEILFQYADGLQRRRLEKTDVAKQTSTGDTKTLSTTRLRLKNFFSLDLLVIAALFIGFAVFVIWGVNRILSLNTSGTSSTDLPEVADVLLATGSPTPQDTPVLDEQDDDPDQTEAQDSEEATPLFTPLSNDDPINIVIIPRQRVWVRVIADGETTFEGRMLPGNAYDFSGEENLEVLTGSAGAIQIFFNEEDLGAPGLVGQVVNLIFAEDGLILPTPTNTPTITETPDVTLTPTPTPTPSQTLEATITPMDTND